MDTILLFAIAIVPIVWLITALGFLKLPAMHACLGALAGTAVLSLLVWKMSALTMLSAVFEGIALALWPIMLVIIAAIFAYNLSIHTKSMETIKKMLSGISSDRRIQVLILAWGFGGFLEAVAGYGTAVAIPAGILAALGFQPVFAAVICLIANTVPTAFGAVGIPVTTLAKVTGLDVMPLSYTIGLQLLLFIVIIPFALVIITTKSFKGLKGVVGITLASGVAFAVPQMLAAKYLGAELPALLGSICSMGVTILLAKYFYKDKQNSAPSGISLKQGVIAWIPYILVFVFIILTSPLFPAVSEFLGQVKTSVVLYLGEGASPSVFKWIATPGTLMILAAVLGGLIQGARLKEIVKVFGKTLKQLWRSTVTVMSIVAMAKVMGYSGMITSIAVVLVKVTGAYFPFIAPAIGSLGTFLTGSDTSSNVLFGSLQVEVAKSTGVDPYWLAAANTSGATAGKMISPQSIAVATSATGLVGSEGKIFIQSLKFCLGYVVVLGVLVLVGSWFI